VLQFPRIPLNAPVTGGFERTVQENVFQQRRINAPHFWADEGIGLSEANALFVNEMLAGRVKK